LDPAAAASTAAPHVSAIQYAVGHMTIEGIVTMSLLGLMSLASWTVIVGKALGLRKQKRLAGNFYTAFEKVGDPFELIGRDAEFEGAPPYSVYDYACREMLKQLDRFAPKESSNGSRRAPARTLAAVRAAMERGIGDETVRLGGGMVILALAISGGPFIGLTGTVFGVMEVFSGVAQAGQANLSAMAPGVAGALVNTVVGLIVAIPSLFAYNMLNTRIDAMSLDMTNFASELEATFTIDCIEIAGGGDTGTGGHRRNAPHSDAAVTH
jgi:biopolymer transport protein ExbB/TolQ